MRIETTVCWTAAALALVGSLLPGCGDDDRMPVDMMIAAEDGAEGECTTDLECDDTFFCNGPERCVEGACEPGTPPACGICVEDDDACIPDGP